VNSSASDPERGQRLRVGVTWNLIPILLLGVVGIGLNFAIGRFWGSAALGVFNQVTTAYFVLASLGAGGTHYSVLRAIAEAPTDRDRVPAVLVGGFVPTAGFAAVMTVLFVLLRHPIGSLLDSRAVADGILWAAPGLFCFIVNKVLLAAVNGLGRMKAFALLTSLRYILIAVGLVLAWVLEVPEAGLAGVWSLTEGVLFVATVGTLIAHVDLRRARGWGRWVRPHVNYGIRGVGSTVLFEFNSRLDVWLLGAALSDARVGVYSMAASMAEGVSQFGVAVQVNVNPEIAADLTAGRRQHLHELVKKTQRWFALMMFAICLVGAVLFPIVIPWITDNAEFNQASWPFAILMLGLFLASPWLPFNQTLLMAGRPGWHTAYVGIVVLANVVGNLLLIPRFELVGAAVATAATTALSGLLLRYLVKRLIDIRV
jgi:O-antigen/teichoic acid export membrane protein